jgi:Ca-activated chloride channel family protein
MSTTGPFTPKFLRCALALIALFVPALLLPTTVSAQFTDDVHIESRPHAAQSRPESAAKLEPTAASPELTHALRVDVDLVLVPVTVSDAGNRPVTGLAKEDFTLFEGGDRQEIRYFSAEDGPISVGVLLDLSNSMKNKIDDAREAVSEFFKTANPEDDYFVISFADSPQLVADSTRSIASIQAKLAAAQPGGHTALLDAVYMGLAKMRSAHHKRRALLIISDGGDNHSRYRKSEIKRLVQETDVEIYAIGIYNSIFQTPEEWSGKRLLTEITEATGGRAITMSNASKLPSIARTISLELRNQYVLGYRPSKSARDGRWHRIKLEVANLPEGISVEPPLHLSFRRGYLGPEQ